MARVLEFVDVCPDFGLPALFMDRTFAAGRAPGVECDRRSLDADWRGILQFDEDTAYFFDFLVGAKQVLVTQQVAETKFPRFGFRLSSVMERAILGPQLFGGVARHPEGFFVGHCWFRPGSREPARGCLSPLLPDRLLRCNSNTD